MYNIKYRRKCHGTRGKAIQKIVSFKALAANRDAECATYNINVYTLYV